jgi:uncharacterized membrane protein
MVQNPNRLLALLSYLLPVVGSIVVFVFDRKNLFALYHACQAFTMAVVAVLLPVGWLLSSWVLGWVPLAGPTLGAATFSVVIAGYLTLVVLWVIGILNALRARMSPLFLVGKWGERLFVRLFPKPVVESST